MLLASTSPRRHTLVRLLGLDCRVEASEVDESTYLLPDPIVGAMNVAFAKARAAQPRTDEIVLAADTLVVDSTDRVLGKPVTEEEARAMLEGLRGDPHAVVSGVALRVADREWGAVVTTRVHMRRYADAEIAAYVARREPFDKAGGYAIQDAGFRPVERIDGCYLNVVGLPICAVARGLETLDVEVAGLTRDCRPPCDYCRAGASLVEVMPSS